MTSTLDYKEPATVIVPPITSSHDAVHALFLTDLHYPFTDIEFIEKYLTMEGIDLIVLNGDLTEGRTNKSPGSGVNEPPEAEALDLLEQSLTLIPSHVPVFGVLGNHDNAGSRASGQDEIPMRRIFHSKGYTYSRAHMIIPIKVGNSLFKWCTSHGAGGGATEASVIKFLKQLKECIISDAHLYTCGHWHRYIDVSETSVLSRLREDGKISLSRIGQRFMAVGSPVNYVNTYAEGGPKNRPYKYCGVKGAIIHFHDKHPITRGKMIDVTLLES